MLSSIAQDPLIRAGIETIADDMTRKFIELTSKGDEDLSIKIGELEADLRAFRVKSLFNRSLSLTGYMGGCLVYIDVGDLDEEEKKAPLYLDSATFKAGSLRGFKIIEPINVYPGVYNSSDPTADNYFNPETWFVLGKEYHKSRFLYFTQNEVPLLLKPLYNFFGISLSQQVLEYVQNFTENRRSAQRLLNKFSLTIWKTDMSAFLSGGDCNSLTQRVKYFNAQRNNDGTALIDKELEDMVQINTPLSGVTDIVSMSLDLAPVILGISKDKYFGDLPKGLNASSEGTNRIYYDKIQSLNEKISYDNVEKVIKILQLNRYGEIDDNISFQFAPLWEMDERERAEINKIHADTAAVYVDRGCLSQEEVRGVLADNPDSGYSNIDVDDVPENDTFADVDLEDKDEAGSVFDEALDEWDESKHPRADNGQFGSGGSATETLSNSRVADFLGKEFTGVKGQAAVDKLMQEKQGHVKGAFTRKDIGDIDLVWGNESIGLSHIIKRRKETGQDLESLLENVSDVIEMGELKIGTNGRFNIQYNGRVAIVKPQFDNEKLQFLLTAFEKA